MDINRKNRIYIWLTIGFALGVILFMPRCALAVAYEAEKSDRKVTYEDRGVEHETPDSVYKDHTEIDQPPEGWYRDPKDFPVPEDWSSIVKGQFQSLVRGLPKSYKSLHKWAKPPIKISTKYIDGKASRVRNPIKLTAPKEWGRFTFFKAEPDNLTLEQDFKGHAVAYNADTDTQYKFRCYSESGYLGEATTVLSDSYVKVDHRNLTDPEYPEGRSRTYGHFAAQDPKRRVYIAYQQPTASGVSYYYPKLSMYDTSGSLSWNYEVNMGYSSPDDYRSGMILNDDGSLIYCTSRVPYTEDVYYYDGPSNEFYGYQLSDPAQGHIAKVLTSGSTVWQQDTRSSYRIVENTAATGFVYVGNHWTTGDYDYYGVLGQLDSSGNVASWGNGSSYITDTDYDWYSVIKSSQNDYVVVGMYDAFSEDLAIGDGGSISGSCYGNGAGVLFDGEAGDNEGDGACCAARYDDGGDWWVQYDFGAGNERAIRKIDMNSYSQGGIHTITVYASNDGASWDTLIEEGTFFGPGTTYVPIIYLDGDTPAYRYWRVKAGTICDGGSLSKLKENPIKRFAKKVYDIIIPSAHAACPALNGIDCLIDGGPAWSQWRIMSYEVYMYEKADYASIQIYEGESGVSEGNFLSGVSFPAATTFYDVCEGRDESLCAVGYDDSGVFVANVDTSLNTNWTTTLTEGTVGQSINPTDDGGYIICGTRTVDGQDRMALIKIGSTGTVEWARDFVEPEKDGAIGRYAIQTEDLGFLAVGGHYPTETSSQIYTVKVNKFGQTCSPGNPCK